MNRDRVGLILITGDREGFFDMQAWKERVLRNLRRTSTTSPISIISRLQAAVRSPPAHPAIPGLRHYLYKSRTYSQITTTRTKTSATSDIDDGQTGFEGIYAEDVEARRRLVTTYQTIHDALHPSSSSSSTRAQAAHAGYQARLVYAVNEHEAVLGMSTTSHELYITLPPLVPKKVATDSAHALARWVKKHESTLFLVTAPHF